MSLSPAPVLLLVVIIAVVVGTAIGIARLIRFIERARVLKGVCPPPARLKQLVAGQVAPADQFSLNRHLEQCQRCQQVLEALVSAADSWPDAAKKIGAGRPAPGEALRKVMDSLKSGSHEAALAAKSVAPREETGAYANLPAGLLSAATRPNLLGMLGPYEIQSVIGQGGMGIVLKGFDTVLQRVVAVKVLAPHLAVSATAHKRFLREAQAVAAVTHEHVVTIYAVDEANGFPYLVMQFVNGQSLQDRIDKQGPLELKEILRIGMQTASGLAAAHAQGLVHRDIKPANILLENSVQRVKITDFGLARAIDDASLTQSGFIAGSPQFMAPEQARGESIDHRADLFSLGSVLYTMSTGRPPFRAESSLAVLRRVSDETPRPIREINPELPDWLSANIEKLHAKNPADRYQTAGEVADALGQRLAQLQQVGWVPSLSPAPVKVAVESALPITSLTICPLCNCRLHIPENKVGQVVDCPECGKPFRVVDASNEIQVLRPAPSDLGVKKRVQIKAFAVVGLVACLIFCCFSPLALVGIWMLRTRQVEGFAQIADEDSPATIVAPRVDPSNLPKTTVGVNEKLQSEIIGDWQVMGMQVNGKPLGAEMIKDLRIVFRADGTYERREDRGTYKYHPLAKPTRVLYLFPKDGPRTGRSMMVKCELMGHTLRLELEGPQVTDGLQIVTLERQR